MRVREIAEDSSQDTLDRIGRLFYTDFKGSFAEFDEIFYPVAELISQLPENLTGKIKAKIAAILMHNKSLILPGIAELREFMSWYEKKQLGYSFIELSRMLCVDLESEVKFGPEGSGIEIVPDTGIEAVNGFLFELFEGKDLSLEIYSAVRARAISNYFLSRPLYTGIEKTARALLVKEITYVKDASVLHEGSLPEMINMLAGALPFGRIIEAVSHTGVLSQLDEDRFVRLLAEGTVEGMEEELKKFGFGIVPVFNALMSMFVDEEWPAQLPLIERNMAKEIEREYARQRADDIKVYGYPGMDLIKGVDKFILSPFINRPNGKREFHVSSHLLRALHESDGKKKLIKALVARELALQKYINEDKMSFEEAHQEVISLPYQQELMKFARESVEKALEEERVRDFSSAVEFVAGNIFTEEGLRDFNMSEESFLNKHPGNEITADTIVGILREVSLRDIELYEDNPEDLIINIARFIFNQYRNVGVENVDLNKMLPPDRRNASFGSGALPNFIEDMENFLDKSLADKIKRGDRTFYMKSVGAGPGVEAALMSSILHKKLLENNEKPERWDVVIEAYDKQILSSLNIRNKRIYEFVLENYGEPYNKVAHEWIRAVYIDLEDEKQLAMIKETPADIVFCNNTLQHIKGENIWESIKKRKPIGETLKNSLRKDALSWLYIFDIERAGFNCSEVKDRTETVESVKKPAAPVKASEQLKHRIRERIRLTELNIDKKRLGYLKELAELCEIKALEEKENELSQLADELIKKIEDIDPDVVPDMKVLLDFVIQTAPDKIEKERFAKTVGRLNEKYFVPKGIYLSAMFFFEKAAIIPNIIVEKDPEYTVPGRRIKPQLLVIERYTDTKFPEFLPLGSNFEFDRFITMYRESIDINTAALQEIMLEKEGEYKFLDFLKKDIAGKSEKQIKGIIRDLTELHELRHLEDQLGGITKILKDSVDIDGLTIGGEVVEASAGLAGIAVGPAVFLNIYKLYSDISESRNAYEAKESVFIINKLAAEFGMGLQIDELSDEEELTDEVDAIMEKLADKSEIELRYAAKRTYDKLMLEKLGRVPGIAEGSVTMALVRHGRQGVLDELSIKASAEAPQIVSREKDMEKKLRGGSIDGTKHRVYKDIDGKLWVFKVYPLEARDGTNRTHRAYVDELASELSEILGLNTGLKTFAGEAEGAFGVFVEFNEDLKKDMWDKLQYGYNEEPDFRILSKKQIITIVKEQILDWLISNHDAHGANFFFGKGGQKSGRIYSIDKAQAFKFFPADELSLTYNPNKDVNGEHNTLYFPIYNILLRHISQGRLDEVTLEDAYSEVAEVIKGVKEIDDDSYRNMIERYAEYRFNTLGKANNEKMTKEEFIEKALKRKNSVEKDFKEFYKNLGYEEEEKVVAIPEEAKQKMAKKDLKKIYKAAQTGDLSKIKGIIPDYSDFGFKEVEMPELHSDPTFGKMLLKLYSDTEGILGEKGGLWLFKSYPTDRLHRAFVDNVVSETSRKLGLEMAVDVKIGAIDGRIGNFHQWVTEDPGFGVPEKNLTNVELKKLSREDIIKIIQERVLDWLVSQHDSVPRHIIFGKDGKPYAIDKAMAYKYIDEDELNLEYRHPMTRGTHPVYNTLFKAIIAGDVKKVNILEAMRIMEETITAVEKMDDDEYKDLLSNYAVTRFSIVSGEAEYPKDDRNVTSGKFLKLALARKKNIRKDFEKFFKDHLEPRPEPLPLPEIVNKPVKVADILAGKADTKITDIKVVAMDMDGTLTPRWQAIEEPNLEAMLRMLESGIKVVIVTGSKLSAVQEQVLKFVPKKKKDLLKGLSIYTDRGSGKYTYNAATGGFIGGVIGFNKTAKENILTVFGKVGDRVDERKGKIRVYLTQENLERIKECADEVRGELAALGVTHRLNYDPARGTLAITTGDKAKAVRETGADIYIGDAFEPEIGNDSPVLEVKDVLIAEVEENEMDQSRQLLDYLTDKKLAEIKLAKQQVKEKKEYPDKIKATLGKYGIKEKDFKGIVKNYKKYQVFEERLNKILEAISTLEQATGIPDFSMSVPTSKAIIKTYLKNMKFISADIIVQRPFIEYVMNTENADRWIKSHPEELKELAAFILKNITYIDQEKFEDALERAVGDLNDAIQKRPYILITGNSAINSRTWAYRLAREKGLPAPAEVFDLSKVRKNASKIRKLIKDSAMYDLVILDDASYSRQELAALERTVSQDIVNKVRKKINRDINLHVVVPFMTGETETQYGKGMVTMFYKQQHLTSIREILNNAVKDDPGNSEKYQEYENLIRKIYDIPGLNISPYDDILEGLTLTYFQHNIADWHSVLSSGRKGVKSKAIMAGPVVNMFGGTTDTVPLVPEMKKPYSKGYIPWLRKYYKKYMEFYQKAEEKAPKKPLPVKSIVSGINIRPAVLFGILMVTLSAIITGGDTFISKLLLENYDMPSVLFTYNTVMAAVFTPVPVYLAIRNHQRRGILDSVTEELENELDMPDYSGFGIKNVRVDIIDEKEFKNPAADSKGNAIFYVTGKILDVMKKEDGKKKEWIESQLYAMKDISILEKGEAVPPKQTFWRVAFQLLGLRAISLTAASIYLTGLADTTGASALSIENLTPVFVLLMSSVFSKKPIGKIDILSMAVIFIGSSLIVLPDASGHASMAANGLLLCSTLLWAGYLIIAEKLLKNVNSGLVTWTTGLFAIPIVYMAAQLLTGEAPVFLWDPLAILSGVFSGVLYVTYMIGLKNAGAVIAATIDTTTPFWNSVINVIRGMRGFSPLHIIGVGLVGTGVGFLSREEKKPEDKKEVAVKPLMIHYFDYSTISVLWEYAPGFKDWFAKLLEMDNVKIILNSTDVYLTETHGIEKSEQIVFIKQVISREFGYRAEEILEKIDFIYTDTSPTTLEGKKGYFTKPDFLEAWIMRNRREGNIADDKELVIVSYDDLGKHLTSLEVHRFQPESKVKKSLTLGLVSPARMGFYGYDRKPDMQILKQKDPDLFDNADIDNDNFIVPEYFTEQVNEKMTALEPEWEVKMARLDPMNRELIKYGIREDDRLQIIKEYKNIDDLKKQLKRVIDAIEIEEKNTNIPDFQIPEPSRVSIIKAYLMREILDEEELEEGEYDFILGEQILKRPFIDNSIDEYKLEKWVKAHKGIYRKLARFMADHITYFNQEKTEDMLGQSLKKFNKEVNDKECIVIKGGIGAGSVGWMHDIGTYKKDGLDWGYHTYNLAEHSKSGFMAGAVDRGAGIVIADDASYSGEQIEFTINNIVSNLKIGGLKRKDIIIHLVIPFMTKQAENRLEKYIIDISEKEGMQITLETYIQQHIETVPDIFQREIAQNPNKKKELEKLLKAFYEMFPFRPRDGYDETLTYFQHKIADYQSVIGISTGKGQRTVLADGVVMSEGGKKETEMPFIPTTMPPYYNITWVEGTNEGRTAAVKSMLGSRRYAKLLGIKSIETGKNTKFRDGILILNEEMHKKVVDVMSWSTDPDRVKNLLRTIVAFEKHKKKKGKKLYSLIAEELKPYMSEIEITALPLWFNKIVPGQVNLKDIEIEEYIRAEMGNWLYNKYPEKADQLIDEVLKINSQINAEKRNIQENMERGMTEPDDEEEEEIEEREKPGIGKLVTILFGRFARATIAVPVEAFNRINPIS
ncbi:EamA family transporter, partial [Elusimicrobiota bacterium]